MRAVNPLLQEMSVNDLQRRYTGSLVRYGDVIVLVDDFIARPGTAPPYIILTTTKGRTKVIFDYKLLDIARPTPRWIYSPEDKAAYYLHYTFDRQWHRGFCKANTIIKRLTHRGPETMRMPSIELFEILLSFYNKPYETIKCSVKDVKVTIKKEGIFQLSPYVVLSRAATDEEVIQTWYREKYIGVFGSIESYFVQEIKELVGDYHNEDDVRNISGSAIAVKETGKKRPVVIEEANDDIDVVEEDDAGRFFAHMANQNVRDRGLEELLQPPNLNELQRAARARAAIQRILAERGEPQQQAIIPEPVRRGVRRP